MRPTDENQHGSTRPNLLSGARRRIVEDDNLLARLERDSARQASGNRSRAAWYAAAASLVLLMIIVVGYMAYESANTVRLFPVAQKNREGTAAIASPREGDSTVAPRLPLNPPGQATAPLQAEAPSTPRDNPAALPPLVLLQAHEVAPNKPVATAKPVTPAATATPVATVKPATIVTPVAATRLAEATPPTQHASVPSFAPAAVKPVRRNAAPAVTQGASTRVAPHAAARPAPSARTRKPAPANPVGDAPVDTDVALLSAIIIHASSHADERAQLESASACARAADKRCAGRPPAHP